MRAGSRRVELERLDAGAVEAAVDAKIKAMLQRYAPQVTERARQILRSEIRHPERSTGRLANSIKYRVSDRSITIYAGAPHALWVEEDTRPHIIRPRAKKALHWVETMVPPTSPSMFGTPALGARECSGER